MSHPFAPANGDTEGLRAVPVNGVHWIAARVKAVLT